MKFSFRTTAIILASLTASGVAPAKVIPGNEPLLASNSLRPASIIVPAVLTVPAAPEAQAPTATVDPVEPNQLLNDEPVDSAPVSGNLSSMVSQLRASDPGSREIECLAGAIYFESKSEPLKGQLAVGNVIANRAKSGRFPSSYCGVVFQRSQFSFVRGHSLPAIPRSGLQWRTAVAIAKIVDQGLQPAAMPKALFFHAARVSPDWRMSRVGAIGNHIFYR